MKTGRPGIFYVTFWGTRGSISTPGTKTEKYGGNTSCVSVEIDDVLLVLDAGTGIRALGLALARRGRRKQAPLKHIHILLSHTHWDHIQGLPFFRPAYEEGMTLHIYGSPKKGRFLESILSGQMDIDYFPVGLSELAAKVLITEISSETIQIGPVSIDWEEQICHPGGSVRYRLSCGDKKIVYSTDVELDEVFVNRKDTRKGKALAREYLEFIRDADLLIADAQYTAEEYPAMAGRGHSSMPLVLRLAGQQSVAKLAAFHHDPEHSDAAIDKIQAQCAPEYAASDPPMNVFWAREGLTLPV
ncbi:MAG: MBL fold metallo-hydrolase [Lentisphaerae bacterium]|nr:MBL fold metallo-hydrolase [Lentisphaerota bacterium]